MRYLTLLVVVAACGSPSGPGGIDPTILITNQTPWPVSFQWRDGQGVIGSDVIPGNTTRCERFFARPDSAYFYIEASDLTTPSSPNTSTMTAPWFDPDARHAWSALITANTPGSPGILVRQDSTVAAC